MLDDVTIETFRSHVGASFAVHLPGGEAWPIVSTAAGSALALAVNVADSVPVVAVTVLLFVGDQHRGRIGHGTAGARGLQVSGALCDGGWGARDEARHRPLGRIIRRLCWGARRLTVREFAYGLRGAGKLAGSTFGRNTMRAKNT